VYKTNAIDTRKTKRIICKRISQKEICSILYISQPTVSRDISFIKNAFQREQFKNNKTKFARNYFMTELTFEIRKKLWEIVDNKKTKTRDKIQTLKQLSDIAVESLELIPILEVMLRVEKLNKYLNKREKIILVMEKIFKEHENIDTKSSKEDLLEKPIDKIIDLDILILKCSLNY